LIKGKTLLILNRKKFHLNKKNLTTLENKNKKIKLSKKISLISDLKLAITFFLEK
jgi:hypothetical protein